MFPAALAIVVQTFPFHSRGRALALFFGIAGGLTAIGPILGGFLTQWTWRAIFWVNIPVALIALALTAIAKPKTVYKAAPIDFRGLFLIASGVALSIFGFQQSSVWGWSNPAIWGCIALGVVLLVVFVFVELRTSSPLMEVRIFRIRAFSVENMVLAISMLVFIPVFFFASIYAQISLGKSASQAGIVLLFFFLGFVVAAQIGGRMLDRVGAKRPVVLGCVLAAVGFELWASKVTDLSFGSQQWYIVLAGAGMGFMLGPATTDAVNRASTLSYGEATGITQTIRNYSASLGIAILGTILVNEMRSHTTASLIGQGLSPSQAAAEAAKLSQSAGGGHSGPIPLFVRLDFAARDSQRVHGNGRRHGGGGRRRGRRAEARPPGGDLAEPLDHRTDLRPGGRRRRGAGRAPARRPGGASVTSVRPDRRARRSFSGRQRGTGEQGGRRGRFHPSESLALAPGRRPIRAGGGRSTR